MVSPCWIEGLLYLGQLSCGLREAQPDFSVSLYLLWLRWAGVPALLGRSADMQLTPLLTELPFSHTYAR